VVRERINQSSSFRYLAMEYTAMTVQSILKVAPLPQRPFTVAEYDRMIEVGILTEDERIELIEGVIVEMSPIGRRHASYVKRLITLLSRRIGDEVQLDIQNPIHLSDYSEPQPDALLLKLRGDYYIEALPSPADVLLVIEVADTSLDYDRNVKVPLYARAGIPEVWVINLAAETVEVYTQPGDPTYQRVQTRKKGDVLTPTTLPDVTLSVDQLFV
jgi:Uma2 family endonuclease